jgi:hypothetical protein
VITLHEVARHDHEALMTPDAGDAGNAVRQGPGASRVSRFDDRQP